MTVTSHEIAIAERLRDAAGRIPVDTGGLQSIEAGGMRVTLGFRPRRGAFVAGVAAVALAGAAAVVVVVGPRSGPDTVTASTQAVCPVAPSDPSACSSSPVAHVESPPDWFGTPRSAIRNSGHRSGRWVSMAIGRGDAETVIAPIRIAVFDGTYMMLDDAEVVTIDGVPLRLVRIDDWRILATTGTPTVLAEGRVDVDTLKAVLDAVDPGNPADGLSLRLRSLPEGYAEIVAPRSLGVDAPYHRTLAGEFGDDYGISEASDWTDPLLHAAGAGVDLTAVDLGNGTTGWVGLADPPDYEPVRFLVWSPEPGVVFSIDTYDLQRSVDDLAALARATTAIDPALWDTTYGD